MSDQENPQNTRKVLYPLTLSVRVTQETYDMLQLIAAFEMMKPTQLCRREIVSATQRYERNPQFKRWLKKREDLKKKGL